jgi:hypothetical protein
MAKLDVATLKVGDVFYGVKDISNAFHRKKIYREIDGEQWFKYDIPAATYSLVTYTVLGILNKTLDGEWEENSDYELSREIYVSLAVDEKVTKYTMYDEDVDSKDYFLDKHEAMSYIEYMYEKDREGDRR